MVTLLIKSMSKFHKFVEEQCIIIKECLYRFNVSMCLANNIILKEVTTSDISINQDTVYDRYVL